MPTAAEAVYAETISPLPREEQLHIASLILQTLTETRALRNEEVVSYTTIVTPKASDIHLRSPRFADPTDALRFQKYEVTEPEIVNDADV